MQNQDIDPRKDGQITKNVKKKKIFYISTRCFFFIMIVAKIYQ